jgi:hypothetical protein
VQWSEVKTPLAMMFARAPPIPIAITPTAASAAAKSPDRAIIVVLSFVKDPFV